MLLLSLVALLTSSFAFTAPQVQTSLHRSLPFRQHKHLFSSWDNFGYDDDDDLLEVGPDEGFVAADENDDPAIKAAAGMALEAPDVSSCCVTT